MKKLIPLILLLLLAGFSACESERTALHPEETLPVTETTIIVVGEGGESGNLFSLAAQTFQREHGGVIFEVNNGDEFVAEISKFVEENGSIRHMEYFGHGNDAGLFLNQEPGVHGGLYAYDPATLDGFLAASIYELPRDTFANGTIRFNGCNVAKGHPEQTNLAQSFANHFHVTVTASLGPTEFSLDPGGSTVLNEMRDLPAGFQANVYMMPTYETAAFVEVFPQAALWFSDLHEGQSYSEGALALIEKGLELNFADAFLPYQNVTGSEALAFCETAFPKVFNATCVLEGEPDEWIRNLAALQMLADAAGASVSVTKPLRNGYIRWADSNDLLTENFTDRMWYTRGEMAELTWNIYQWRNRGLK